MDYEVKPGDMVGLYKIKNFLNQGGMAYIILASLNERNYALKIAKFNHNLEQYRQNNQAAKKEARLLGSLEHDRIVKVFPLQHNLQTSQEPASRSFYTKATELPESPWYFSMEYLSGGTLDNYIKKCGPLNVREATNIIGNIGLGLGYLHDKGIAHNDLKAENIVFRNKIRKGEPYDPVLIDFGTASGVKGFVDEAGSWYVMSPERVRLANGIDAPELAIKIDPSRADIWSLGILLYQSLTNSLPFSSSNHKKLSSQILNETPDPISKWNKAVPSGLDQFVVNNCLSKKAEDRPTVREFLRFIYQFSGRGVPAESIKDDYYRKKII